MLLHWTLSLQIITPTAVKTFIKPIFNETMTNYVKKDDALTIELWSYIYVPDVIVIITIIMIGCLGHTISQSFAALWVFKLFECAFIIFPCVISFVNLSLIAKAFSICLVYDECFKKYDGFERYYDQFIVFYIIEMLKNLYYLAVIVALFWLSLKNMHHHGTFGPAYGYQIHDNKPLER